MTKNVKNYLWRLQGLGLYMSGSDNEDLLDVWPLTSVIGISRAGGFSSALYIHICIF